MNETREKRSDNSNAPLVWYVYILEMGTGELYIGQTNDLETRIAEHTVGGGAKATAQSTAKLVWFSHTHDREAAHRMEARLQAAYERAPEEVRGQVDRFHRLIRLVLPEKTLRELEEEQAERDQLAASAYHLLTRKDGDVFLSAVCGYRGHGDIWERDARSGTFTGVGLNASAEARDIGSMNPATLLQWERERKALEGVGGVYGRRPVCVPCYRQAEAAPL